MAKPKEARRLVDVLLNYSYSPAQLEELKAMELPPKKRRRLVVQARKKADKREARAKAASSRTQR